MTSFVAYGGSTDCRWCCVRGRSGEWLSSCCWLVVLWGFPLDDMFRWIFVLHLGSMIPLLRNLVGGFPLVGIIPCLGGRLCLFSLRIVGFYLGGLFSLLAVGSCSWISLALVPLLGSLYSLSGFCLVTLQSVKVFFCNKGVVLRQWRCSYFSV